MDFLQLIYSIVLIIIFFGGSIFVHELGHYLAARRRGLKVERFSIGFGPKLWSMTRDGVEWCVCAFPLGGYVALPQLAHLEGIEGESKEDLSKLPPISYTDTVIVAVMGVVFNIIFAFVLGCVLWVVGRPTTVAQNTTIIGTVMTQIADTQGAQHPGPGLAAGLQPNDTLVAIDGYRVKSWRDIKQVTITGTQRDADKSPIATLEILRDGKPLTLLAHPILSGPEKLRSLGILPREDLLVGEVLPNSPAALAGFSHGDHITTVNGHPVYNYYDYSTLLEKNGTTPVTLTYTRAEKTFTTTLTPQMVTVSKKGDQEPLIGLSFDPQVVIVHQDPITQIVDAASLTWRTLTTLVNPSSDIKLSHMSGPPGIAWIIHRLSADLRQLLSFILIINVNLAILNMLPLPVLDGGHIVIATLNRIRQKTISVQTIAMMQNLFSILLLGLMVYVIFFADVPRVGREWKEEAKYNQQAQEALQPVFSPAPTAK